MKKIILGALALTITVTSFAQKPKKTYDENKFVKKVQFSMTPELIGKWMPNDAALEYIAEKSGTPLADLKAANEKNTVIVKQNAKDFVAYGLPYIIDEITVEVKQESPVKIANILAHCHTKDQKFVLNLTNCIQTNISWYLGDGIVPEGAGFEAVIAAKGEKKKKGFGGLLGKMNDMNEGMKDMENDAQLQLAVQKMKQDSLNDINPGYEADGEGYYYAKDKYKKTFDGYYILNDGTLKHATIAYDKEEYFTGKLAGIMSLFICKALVDGEMNILNSNLEPNFKAYIKKQDIKAYYINNTMYKKVKNVGWVQIIQEGAIQTYNSAEKVKTDNGDVFIKGKFIKKINGPYSGLLMGYSKDDLSKMMADAPEIVKAYQNGIYTPKQAIIEYNAWYEKTYPGTVNYILGINGRK